MAEFGDFLPIRRETLATIRPRVDADANAGIDPASDRFIDLAPGGFYWDLTQALLIEVERLYDVACTEVPAIAFISYAWGRYLDLHGEVLQVPRKDASRAVGTVTFTGEVGSVIGTGVQIATAIVDPDQDPVVVQTITSGVIPASGTLDLTVEALEAGAAGNVPTSTLTQLLTPVDGITAVTNVNALTSGAEVESDQAYRERLLLEVGAAHGSGTISDYQRWALAYPGVGYVTVEPIWAGVGTVRVIVMDPNNDPVGQTVVDGLQALLDPPVATTTLSGSGNVSLTTSTITVASTTGFTTSGRFYVAGQALSYTGKTATTFTGVTGGTGTAPAGSAVTQGGQGTGKAPIGAEVTVATGALVTVNVAATVTHRTGFSLDGTSGTQATRPGIVAALTAWMNSLPPGEDVILNKVESLFFDVAGVYNVSGVTLNGSAADVPLTALQVAQLGTVTLA